ncbi:MAG: DUF928 domain-containing protein [Xenococcaceae cyanobacterium]
MDLRKSFQYLAILTGILSPALGAFALVPQQLPVEPYPESLVSINFPAPPNRGRAQSTVGGARRGAPSSQERSSNTVIGEIQRGSCTDENQTPLTALMPSDRMVTMVAPNPTMFWYVPRTSTTSAEFVIENEQGKSVYSQTFDLPGDPGVVKLSLPETVSLELNKSYKWKFALICTSNDRDDDEYVRGKLKRTALSADQGQELGQAFDPIEKAKLYAEFYLWNETIALVAQLRDSNPNEWKELLNSVGIEEEKIIEAPFVGTLGLSESRLDRPNW